VSLPKVVFNDAPAHRIYQVVGWSIAFLMILYIVYVAPDYLIIKFTVATTFALAVLGLNLVTGLSGQVSLGHSAFFGTGAYTTAILMVDYKWPFLLTLPVSAAIGFVVGFLVGLPALRIRGLYLALVTLAIGVAFPTFIAWLDSPDHLYGWIPTGGQSGKTVEELGRWKVPGWLPGTVSLEGWFFIIVVTIAGIMFLFANNLIRSRVGRGLVALRDNEIGAAVSGVYPAAFKTMAFAYSSLYAAVAGSLYTLAVGTVSPNTFGLQLSIQFITGLVVGGIATLSGSVIGGLFIEFVPYWASDRLPGPRANILLGLVLIIVIFIAPGGIMYLVRALRARVVRFIPRLPTISAAPSGAVPETRAVASVAAASVTESQGGDA
jgi:branched-chain amino acid transport system permease protein